MVVAWIFSVCIIADCTFIRIGLSDAAYSDLSEFGIFQVNLDAPGGHRCAAYPASTFISAGFKTARAFGVLASLLLGVAMVQVACLQLFTDYKRDFVWTMVKVEIIMAFVCQLLTFSAFAEDNCSFPANKCVPGAVGILAIINVIILMVLIWMYWVLSPPDFPTFEIRQRAPPPPTSAPPTTKPPTLEEQMNELEESIEIGPVALGTFGVFSEKSRGPDTSEDDGSEPPVRSDVSFNDGIEDPNVPLDKIEEEELF